MALAAVTYVLPTRDRPAVLARTLAAIGSLPTHDAEVIVVDNASGATPRVERRLANGIPTRLITLDRNAGAAARNVGVQASDPACPWIVMLDDDSSPVSLDYLRSLAGAPADVLAVSADIHLPTYGTREHGGLPEVFIGCGVAIRRDAFLDAGGYDEAFNYYVEEYDLAARLLLMGGRVAFEPTFRVDHHKVNAGRDMDLILERLVRNNGWVAQRYCPDEERRDELRRLRTRYRAIAAKERATAGFVRGLIELRRTRASQPRTPMPREVYDRFTGLTHARAAIGEAHRREGFCTAALTARGKNDWAIELALREHGVRVVAENRAEALVIGTLSPGPMLDAMERGRPAEARPVIAPWVMAMNQPMKRAAA